MKMTQISSTALFGCFFAPKKVGYLALHATIAFLATTASAGTLTITDGGDGLPYGDTEGFVVDFDSNYAFSPALIPGRTYSIDSISIWEASDSKDPPESTPAYVSVFDSTFAGFNGATEASHLGHSDNAIDHTATTDSAKITYTFTDILVTADDDGALSGSGLVYFTWDDDTVRNNFGISSGVHPYQRIDSNPPAADYGAAVYAFGAVQLERVPEIEISVTLQPIPEPSTLALVGLAGLGIVGPSGFIVGRNRARRSRRRSRF